MFNSSVSRVDTEKLSQMIISKRGDRTLRMVAKEISISPSTLSRLERGVLPEINTYLAICDWLSVSPEFFLSPSPQKGSSSMELVIELLRADRSLSSNTKEALIQLVKLAYDSDKAQLRSLQ
jgi:transcriptional regulator with XRE-family HTH domain